MWDDPYLFRVCSDGLLKRCLPADEGIKIIENATHLHMEEIMVHFALMQKSSRVDCFGQQCMKTQRILSRCVMHVRDMGI
jgi:hypothetical protein